MKRVFIIHGWSGSPDTNWLPWLKKELEEKGCEVHVPSMSDKEDPVIEEWVSKLTEVVGKPDSDTYFVGHSIGCQAILRYLETVDTPVAGALFVAGWFDLKNLEDDETEQVAKPWIEIPIDIEKITSVLPKSILLISDDDPYDAFEENKEKFGTFVSKTTVLHNAEHITEDVEPAVLEAFDELVSL